MSSDIHQRLRGVDWGRQQEDGEVLLSPAWEVFVLGISILSVFNLVVVAFFVDNPDIAQVFVIMDSILTVLFLLDVGRRLSVADERSRYLVKGYGWIDVLAAFPVLRILRLLRIVRVIRIMQRLGGPLDSFKAFFSNRAAGGLLSVLLVAVLVMEFGALAVLWVERGAPGANIETAQDAVWYLLVTMSTVGYGDFYPVTDAGRLVGSLIIVVGVGVFGTLTGFLANAFLAPSEVKEAVETAAAASADGSDGQLEEDGADESTDPGGELGADAPATG